jgi:hypothetical protein
MHTFNQQSQPQYGNRADNVHLSASDAEKIDLSKFDESDPYQHMMKILFGCGVYCMFRGKEHAAFNISQVKFGNYPRSFEYPNLAGHPFVSIDNLLDKTCRLTVNNNYARSTSEFLRFPIVPDSPSDFGASLQRYMSKLAPNQTRMYCRVASPEYIEANFRRHGNLTSIFYPNTPLGMNKLKDIMVQGAKILGIKPNFKPHALRAVGVTKLANDSSISDAERCRAARHSTVNASKCYQTVDGRSEANRLKALGVVMPSAPFVPKKVEAVLPSSPPMHTYEIHLQDPRTALEKKKEEENSEVIDLSAAVREQEDGGSVSSGSDPMLSIHKKGSNGSSVSSSKSGHSSMTQHDLQELQNHFVNLQDLMDKGKSTPKPAQSLTQAGIQDLEEKIQGLQDLLKRDRKPPALSENQLAIRALQSKVKKLTDELEHKELYVDSLEHDFFEDRRSSPNRNFEEIAYRKRQLERENRELMEYIARDKNRGSRRNYRRY